jgi:hypothetical protein
VNNHITDKHLDLLCKLKENPQTLPQLPFTENTSFRVIPYTRTIAIFYDIYRLNYFDFVFDYSKRQGQSLRNEGIEKKRGN